MTIHIDDELSLEAITLWCNDIAVFTQLQRSAYSKQTYRMGMNSKIHLIRRILQSKAFFIKQKAITVGSIEYKTKKESTEIVSIVISPQYQNKGIGKKVLKFLIGKKMTQAQTIKLTARKKNEGAIRLYQSLGFEIISETENNMIIFLELQN